MPETSPSEPPADEPAAPAPEVARLTPMLRHYMEVKEAHPDTILLYRMGDFFELFFDDAVRAAPLLEVSLTARQKGTPSEAPMCGVPHHAIEGYIGKLLAAGLRVAICDQVEDPREAKGLVRREVTRIVSPGTISEPDLLEGGRSNRLAAIVRPSPAVPGAGAFLEVSTGDFFLRPWQNDPAMLQDLELWAPSELLIAAGEDAAAMRFWAEQNGACVTRLEANEVPTATEATRRLERHLGVESLRGFGLEEGDQGATALAIAAAVAIDYAASATRSELAHVRGLRVDRRSDFVTLDEATVRNLELFRNQRDGGRRDTLLASVDRTGSSAGARLLRDWLAQPLRQRQDLLARQDAVAELTEEHAVRERLRRNLAGIADFERLAGRAVLGSIRPREGAALRDGLASLPALAGELAGCQADQLRALSRTDPVADLCERLQVGLVETPSLKVGDGGVIAEGLDAELDRHRSLARDGKRHLAELEARLRLETGISNLKVRYNKVFGYFLEVTRSHQDKVPEAWTRKQTLANAERYINDELKELEDSILGAEDQQATREKDLWEMLVGEIAAQAMRLRDVGYAVAMVDVLAGLAEVAAQKSWCRPTIAAPRAALAVEDGRHPVVEAAVGGEYVPNDIHLDPEKEQIVLLTGPNMGGKSTYLRQAAVITLLAHTGSFVPARVASVPIVDRIFTRVGASDDLARGESTFMVEMIETANILRHATADSLVILDEVGRGTATFDGLSLAWAIVEHLHEHSGALTLFATHYHELTELQALLERVTNRTMAVREWEERIVLLHRVVNGSADKSYGLQVARLAGVPETVVARAGEILANLEAHEYDPGGRPRLARGPGAPTDDRPGQLGLFTPDDEVVLELLRDLDLDRLTPLAALNLLASLKERL